MKHILLLLILAVALAGCGNEETSLRSNPSIRSAIFLDCIKNTNPTSSFMIDSCLHAAQNISLESPDSQFKQ